MDSSPSSKFISLEDFITEEEKLIQEVQEKAKTSKEIASWALKTTDSNVPNAIKFLKSPWEFGFNQIVFARVSSYIMNPRSVDLKLAGILKKAKELNESAGMVKALRNFVHHRGRSILIEESPTREKEFQDIHSLVSSTKISNPSTSLNLFFPSSWSPEAVFKGSWTALLAGSDSIGIQADGLDRSAALRASYTVCRVICDYFELSGRKAGFTIGGQIDFPQEAMAHLTVVESTLGVEWLLPELFLIEKE